MRTLEQTLSYRNDRVLNKFRTQYSVTRGDAEEIATETYRWLWLNAQLKEDRKAGRQDLPGNLVIHVGLVIVDEFWHTFILHTKEYAEFCAQHFSAFIHHTPSSPDFIPPDLEETERQLEYICDVVGEDTLTRWYEEYPERYSIEALVLLQKPRVFGRPCEAITT